MELNICINQNHLIESANYVTNVQPVPHPDRVLDVHDFLYIIDGTWEIYENDIPYNLVNDDLLILTAGSHHYGLQPSSKGNRHMYIHLYTESTSDESTAITLSTLYHCASNPKVKHYFRDIISVYWGESEFKSTKLSLLFGLLLCELNAISQTANSTDRHSNLISEVTSTMQSNPQTLYSCKTMADAFYICPRTLSNIFKQAYGVSFYAYQMNMKLEMVRQYLTDHPDELLCNVAKNFGFYDEYHLSKTYKKKYGESPKKWIAHQH